MYATVAGDVPTLDGLRPPLGDEKVRFASWQVEDVSGDMTRQIHAVDDVGEFSRQAHFH